MKTEQKEQDLKKTMIDIRLIRAGYNCGYNYSNVTFNAATITFYYKPTNK
jgi:hypothetical protein